MAPTWEWECTFGQVCQAGAATLGGGAALSQTFTGYQSTAGYAGFFVKRGSQRHLARPRARRAGPRWSRCGTSTWPARRLAPAPSTLDLLVNGQLRQVLDAAPTTAAQPWATLTTTVPLLSGTDSIKVVSTTPDSFDLGIDTLAVGPAGSPPPAPPSTGPLGGWFRGFDTDTYNDTPTCAPGQSGATCQAGIQPLNTDGLLDTAGWRLLDDTQSAVWTANGWVRPRPAQGDIGGRVPLRLRTRLRRRAAHLGAAHRPGAPSAPGRLRCVVLGLHALLEWRHRECGLPRVRLDKVPLNTLSLDTDWKAPNDWNGWEWDSSLFPDPAAFLSWAHSHDIDVTLNIHSSIEDNDPKLPEAERIAGRSLASSSCTNGNCKVWDWSSIPQAESNFALQQSFQAQGVSFWWLDWCCDDSVVSAPGVTPGCVDRPSLRPGHGQPRRAWLRPGPHRRLQCRPAAGVPGGPLVGPHLGHRVHR